MSLSLDLIAGARPNFVKLASIIDAVEKLRLCGKSIEVRLVHTGQHFDQAMSGSFFDQLGLPAPDVNLGAGGGTIAEQTSSILVGYERQLTERRPDFCVVVGDVTSTMACALSAKRAGVAVAHVEAGIRSGDWSMPEEVNRVVTDAISDLYFTTSRLAGKNLQAEGVKSEKIYFVGNTMIDTLLKNRPRFSRPKVEALRGIKEKGYVILTLHRPSNVDSPALLASMLNTVVEGLNGVPVIFPAHPRTLKSLQMLPSLPSSLFLTDPLPYLEFNWLVENARGVLTDSGGITEEATVLGVPCGTIRTTTERPETVEIGTNELLGVGADRIRDAAARMADGKWKAGSIPELWDGLAGGRIVEALLACKS